jgi:hypothetical protein
MEGFNKVLEGAERFFRKLFSHIPPEKVLPSQSLNLKP